MNGLGVIGRIISTTIAARIGSLNVMIPMTLCTALLGYAWLGALIQLQSGSYLGVQILSGTSMLLSALFFFISRTCKVGWTIAVV